MGFMGSWLLSWATRSFKKRSCAAVELVAAVVLALPVAVLLVLLVLDRGDVSMATSLFIDPFAAF
jgi:hypothetical protein